MIIRKIRSGILKAQTYIVWDEVSRKGAVIDPCGKVGSIMKIIRENDLAIEYILNTHYHPDHTNGNRTMKRLTGAKILIGRADVPYLMKCFTKLKLLTLCFSRSHEPDIMIDSDAEIVIGGLVCRIIPTPGHTPGGLCFLMAGKLFTGDTLFVGDSGATVFPGSDRPALGASIRWLMAELPDTTEIFPGHDYGVTETSTLRWEKRHNVNAREYGYYEGGSAN
ncbi:MAG TPA: MBL fold metallo-hydrolase [Spirochaetota bacterium]|nr:MBL fold metallo-hydrolase [Spirochaetota bacterium]